MKPIHPPFLLLFNHSLASMNYFTSFFLLVAILNGLLFQQSLADSHLVVRAKDADTYCFILPKSQMSIGDSENGSNDLVNSWCTQPYDGQWQLPNDFWTDGPHFEEKRYNSGDLRYKQITGCIDASKLPTLIPSDDGGQYDSNGGDGGRGNPTDSSCRGFSSYVELVEPSSGRICIRCCKNPNDCPTYKDTQGCEAVIPGQYC